MSKKNFKFTVPDLPETETRFPRGDPSIVYDTSKDIEFQITDWFDRDVELTAYGSGGGDDSDEDENDVPDPREYVIDAFGVTESGHSVSCSIRGFKPHFFIKVDGKSKGQIAQFVKENITHKAYAKKKYDRESGDQITETHYRSRSFPATNDNGEKVYYTYGSALDEWEIVNKEDLGAGFTGIPAKKFKFIKLTFVNESAMRSCRYMLQRQEKKLKIGIYEANIPPMLRFMHIRQIMAAGWVKVTGDRYTVVTGNKERETITQLELQCDQDDIHPIDKDIIAPIREASFDIECYSSNHGRMPVPEDPENKCIQIATTIYDYGSKEMKKHIVVLGECGDIPGVTVVRCKTEAELLCKWSKFLRETDPDILHGYNIFGFDLNYIVVRSKLPQVNCFQESSFMGRFKWAQSDIVEKELKSAAYGANYMKLLPMPGRQHIDVLKVMQRDFVKYPSYKLGFISQEILSNKIKKDMIYTEKGSSILKIHHPGHSFKPGAVFNLIDVEEFGGLDYYDFNKTHIVLDVEDDYYTFDVTHLATETCQGGGELIRVFETKHDMPPKQLFEFFATGDPEKIKKIAEYCVQDTMLPQKIVNKKCILEDLIAMANVVYVPIGFLIIRGQQIKVFSLLLKFCREYGILVPTLTGEREVSKTKFKGATVLTALSGAYFDGIACLDFAALYPSNMIDWNLCYSMLVRDQKYMNLEGVQYHTFDLGAGKKYTYAQSAEGILQKMLNHLLNARAGAKKKMAAATDPFMKNKYNCEQNAYKVTCNSVYGFTGAEATGMLPCRPIAETTTFIGRTMIEQSQDFAENPDNVAEIVNCVNYFPLEFTYLVMFENNRKAIFTGEQILGFFDTNEETLTTQRSIHLLNEKHDNFHQALDKKTGEPKQLWVWTTERWQQISTLYAKREIDPTSETKEKRWLMRVKSVSGNQLTFEKYQCTVVYGDSVTGDTKIDLMNNGGDVDSTTFEEFTKDKNWDEYKKFKTFESGIHEKEQYIPEEDIYVWAVDTLVTMQSKWAKIKRFIRHKTVKDIYRVVTTEGTVDVTEDHSLFDKDGYPIKPYECEVGTSLLHSSPIRKKLNYNERVLNVNTYGCRIQEIYKLRTTDPDEFVYDIETEFGTFRVGGNIIAKNTDSIFTNFNTKHLPDPVQKIAYSMIIGAYVANKITDYLRSLCPYRDPTKMRTELEYEKVYLELFLLTKKRYVGSLYTFDPENMSYFDQKGVALKRRDYCKFVKEVFRNIIKCFFDKNEPDTDQRIANATRVVTEAVDDLLHNRVPFDKLILSKLLKDCYKVREITNTKTKGVCRFGYDHLDVGDTVFWNDQEYGRCAGKIIKMNDAKSVGGAINFGKEPKQKRRKTNIIKPVIVECDKVKVGLKEKEDDEDDDTPKKKGRLIYDYENFQYPTGKIRYEMDFEDIAAKDGYEISLKTVMDPETKESDLDGVKQAHVRLARRMYIRDPGSAPESGVRVPYVFVERNNKDALQHEKSEDPEYARKNNLKIDPEYYLLHQLKTPISQMFALVMRNPEQELFEKPLERYKLSQTGQRNITSFFKRK